MNAPPRVRQGPAGAGGAGRRAGCRRGGRAGGAQGELSGLPGRRRRYRARPRRRSTAASTDATPDALRARILAEISAAREPERAGVRRAGRRRSRRRRRWSSASSALVSASFGLGAACAAAFALLVLSPPERTEQPSLTEQIVAGHIRAMQPGHLEDVASSDRHTVKPWFDGRLDFAPPVKDFAAGGFRCGAAGSTTWPGARSPRSSISATSTSSIFSSGRLKTIPRDRRTRHNTRAIMSCTGRRTGWCSGRFPMSRSASCGISPECGEHRLSWSAGARMIAAGSPLPVKSRVASLLSSCSSCPSRCPRPKEVRAAGPEPRERGNGCAFRTRSR